METWLQRLPEGHPRLYVRPEQIEALRESRKGERQESWRGLKAAADAELAKKHEYPEPPFLGDWSVEYQKTYDLWLKILRETRAFVTGAQTLALAYLASGDRRYGEAACRRLDSVARWDPDGSSHIAHNDEAHMSVMWWGPAACDWVWDVFTPEQRRRVIAHFRRRGQITFEQMHARGGYGVTDFRSHSGREIVFLANLAMVFHRHIPEAEQWLRWLRPVLCGVWPIWAGADGAWAEGIMYGFAYVNIMTTFASALKEGCGVDLYRRITLTGRGRRMRTTASRFRISGNWWSRMSQRGRSRMTLRMIWYAPWAGMRMRRIDWRHRDAGGILCS